MFRLSDASGMMRGKNCKAKVVRDVFSEISVNLLYTRVTLFQT